MGRLDDLLSAVSRSAPESKYIRAYHGSPYDWDKVDMSMVGKGEGPLDEGFGLYATEKPDVANWYRHRNASLRRGLIANDMRRAYRAGDSNALAEARGLASRLQRVQPHGRTYELEVAVPESSLLQWDGRLRGQEDLHDKLRSVDKRLFDDLVEADPVDLGADGRMFIDDGAHFYNFLAGGTIFDSPTIAGQRRASERLFQAGIPGHSYRGNADNYVFYPGTEDSIRILRKYGIMAPIAAGAMGEE